MPNKKYKVGGLFSGVGGIELGFQKTNKFKIAWSTDVDPYAAKTYRANFKQKFYEENINNLDEKTLEALDILAGGFPCQASPASHLQAITIGCHIRESCQ